MKIKKKKYQTGLDKNGKFAAGNQFGKLSKRPHFIRDLDEAIRIVETEKRKSLFVHYIEKAFENTTVLNALFNKLKPNLAHISVSPEGKVMVEFELKDFRENKKKENPGD